MSAIQGIVSDFGGVLTSPLLDSFIAYQEHSGISLEQLGHAMLATERQLGENPLFRLERGQLAETEFLSLLSAQLSDQLGRQVSLGGMGEHLMETLRPNERLIEYMRELGQRGLKLAICTNNVREWEARWRAKLPVDEIFSVVVDSAFVGSRKPEPRIYEVTLARLELPASATLLLDDMEVNCEGARALGMQAVCFRDSEQAITEIERALAGA
ncbi:MAG: HAD family phosphatase [Actinomycetota bacterium]|nr:HAD family phosphatase [Actinomycetota bacterium]